MNQHVEELKSKLNMSAGFRENEVELIHGALDIAYKSGKLDGIDEARKVFSNFFPGRKQSCVECGRADCNGMCKEEWEAEMDAKSFKESYVDKSVDKAWV